MLLKVQGGHADALTHSAGPWWRGDGIRRAQILDPLILPVLPAGSWRASQSILPRFLSSTTVSFLSFACTQRIQCSLCASEVSYTFSFPPEMDDLGFRS